MTFKQPAQDALFEPNAFRSSDHDAVVVGLDMCDGRTYAITYKATDACGHASTATATVTVPLRG